MTLSVHDGRQMKNPKVRQPSGFSIPILVVEGLSPQANYQLIAAI